jgi:hypothetical protein
MSNGWGALAALKFPGSERVQTSRMSGFNMRDCSHNSFILAPCARFAVIARTGSDDGETISAKISQPFTCVELASERFPRKGLDLYPFF